MDLRDYQLEAIDSIRADVKESKKALCCAFMGAGKTVIFSKICSLAVKNNKRVLILVQKNMLAKQALETSEAFDIRVSVFSAGLKQKDIGQVTIASIQSLSKYKKELNFDIVILDEVHRFSLDDNTNSAKVLLEKLYSPIVIGFTATPFTAKDFIYGEDKFWGKLSTNIDAKYLTDKGYLVPLVCEAPREDKRADVSDVKKRGGDFIESELGRKILSNKELIDEQIEDALLRSKDRKYRIWLAVNIEHAEYLYSKVPWSYIVHSKRKDREDQMAAFKSSDGGNLISVLVASEGFNFPPADCLIMMRPTRSPVLYRQAAGRVIRTYKDKINGLFLDYGGIIDELGSIYQNVSFKKKQKNDLKLCEECGSYNPISVKKCYKCDMGFMVMCEICFSMKRYGETCKNCKGKKRDINPYKNLSSRAYDPRFKKIDFIRASRYKSKKGNDCVKISYYRNMGVLITEYFAYENKWQMDKLKLRCRQIGCGEPDLSNLDKIKLTNDSLFSIKIKRNDNGYKEIEDIYFERGL